MSLEMSMRIERHETGQRTYEDVVYNPSGLTINLLAELRNRASTFAAGGAFNPEEAPRIRRFISQNAPRIMDVPEQVEGASCSVIIKEGDIVEIYGHALPYQAAVAYPRPELRHASIVAREYPQAAAVVAYYCNI